jgi:hypothetical protein
LQAPLRGIRQKRIKDETQMHRISDPASHLQRGAHKSEKKDEQSPGTDIILKRAHLTVTHPKAAVKGGHVGPAEPQVWPNLDGFPAPSAMEGRLPPPSQRRYPRSRAYLTREPTSPHYLRVSTHPLKASNSFSFSYTRRKSSSSAPLVPLE